MKFCGKIRSVIFSFSFTFGWTFRHRKTFVLVLFSKSFWRDSCQEVGHPFLEEHCALWRSLWQVLPGLLVLHPLKATRLNKYFLLLHVVLNVMHPSNQSIVKQSSAFHKGCSTMFLFFPKEYYTLERRRAFRVLLRLRRRMLLETCSLQPSRLPMAILWKSCVFLWKGCVFLWTACVFEKRTCQHFPLRWPPVPLCWTSKEVPSKGSRESQKPRLLKYPGAYGDILCGYQYVCNDDHICVLTF